MGLLFFCSIPAFATSYLLPLKADGVGLEPYVSYRFSALSQPDDVLAEPTSFMPLSQGQLSLEAEKIWYQLSFENPHSHTGTWYINTRLPKVPELKAYQKNSQGKWQLVFDNSGSFYRRALHHPLLLVPVTIKAHSRADLLLEYQGFGTNHLSFKLYDQQQIYHNKSQHILGNGIQIGIILLIGAVTLLQFFLTPNCKVLSYLGFTLTVVLFFAEASGFNFWLLWPNSPEWNLHSPVVVTALVILAYFLFSIQIFELKKRFALLYRIVMTVVTVMFICLLLNFWFELLFVMMILAVLFSPLPLVIGGWAVKQRLWSARLFLLGACAHLVITYLVAAYVLMGGMPGEKLHILTLLKLGFMVQILLFAASLIVQGRQIRDKLKDTEQRRLEEAQTLLKVEQEKNHLMQQSQQKMLELSMVAHDLMQPLSGIRLALAAVDDKRSAQAKEVITRTIHFADDMVKTLIGDLKQQYLSTEQQVSMDVDRILHGVIADKLVADKDSARIRVFSSQREILVLPLITRRILSNLIDNALRYGSNKDILVGQRLTREGIALCVYDSGKGMTPEQIEQLLRPFKREDKEQTGFGLGLYIVASLCAKAGYQFQIKSVPGKGSCFAVTVPGRLN